MMASGGGADARAKLRGRRSRATTDSLPAASPKRRLIGDGSSGSSSQPRWGRLLLLSQSSPSSLSACSMLPDGVQFFIIIVAARLLLLLFFGRARAPALFASQSKPVCCC